MTPRTQPPQQPPPAQKVRLRYAKRGPARFTSHRDFGRALERALRRAAIPMAYSSGFTPHPRISYPNAAPTGAASEAEYVELGLTTPCDPNKIMAALNQVLPSGFQIMAAAEATPRSLGELLQISRWRIELPGVDEMLLPQVIVEFLERDHVTVERTTKKGRRQFDVRRAVREMRYQGSGIEVVLVHHEPLVRPDDVVQALAQISPELDLASALMTRLDQGLDCDGEIADPLR